MLGRHSPQGELFRPDNIHMDHVGRDSLYGFLAQERHRLFRDEDFADLYKKDWGRPSVPPIAAVHRLGATSEGRRVG